MNRFNKLTEDAYNSKDYDKAYLYSVNLIKEEDTAENNFLQAKVLIARGNLSNAIKVLKRVLELDPGHTEAAISLSIVYNDIGHYQEGQKIYDSTTNRVKNSDSHINSKFALKHFELGEMYYSYNRFEEALSEYKKGARLSPSNEDIRIKMAKTYAKVGLFEKALNELKVLISEQPGNSASRVALGLLYYSRGNIIEAQAEWQKAVSVDNNKDARMYLNLSGQATETSLDYH